MKSIHHNQTGEWSFRSRKSYRDPFNEIEVVAQVRHASGEERRVPAFWAGGHTWRVRFASPRTGWFHLRTVCSDPTDAGLHGQEAEFVVTRYRGTNPLYRHGPIQVAAGGRHFAHADGTPFFWLGDTWWMGLTKRLDWPRGFNTLLADRVQKGFSVIQIVAGLYPDMPAFDPRGANEAGFPWEKDYARIRPAYFDKADRRIQRLVEAGLVPCLVGCWGYFLPWMGIARMKQHWRNLIARYGSYPVLWCLAGEGIMPYYLSSTKEADAQFQKRGWNEVGAYVRSIDPYHRPITLHPGTSGRRELSTRQHIVEKNARLLTSLTEGWRFRNDPANCGEAEGWSRGALDAAWKPIRITDTWTAQGYDYHGAAWYAADCAAPAAARNPVYLLFHAVDGTAKVWIDGELVGEQARSALLMWNQPWALDVSRHLAGKTSCRLVVKVVKDEFACGIYRPVELREANDLSALARQPPSAAAPIYEFEEADGVPSVLDVDMLQTGHGDRSSLPNTVLQVSTSYRLDPPMPVVNGEVCYEGIGEFCRPEVQRLMFWATMLNGAKGFTYGANGVWQVNTRRRPYGPSPHGMSWGDTPWDEAHRLPGSDHLAKAKRFLEKYPWWQLEPHPEWVEPHWTEELFGLPFTVGRHDIPLAAGIPGQLRLIYVPVGTGLKRVVGLEPGVPYQARLFNPVSGAEEELGRIEPDAAGSWRPHYPGVTIWWPFPIYQDWVVALETKGSRTAGAPRGRRRGPRRAVASRGKVNASAGQGRTA